jgi:hypothetical protein
MLKDGTVGFLDINLEFQSPPGDAQPSPENPIVARLAFWADDESCKVNINTASEPTYMGKPTHFHERDKAWADRPAARSEYQRFPGHPATVALSSIFYPVAPFESAGTFNPDPVRRMDMHLLTGGAENQALSIKQRIYDLAPRIHTGGSLAGTAFFVGDDFESPTNTLTSVAIEQALNERLYASVDELLFSMQASGTERQINDTSTDVGPLFDKQSLERASAFLTAKSRASEVNLFGLPKIAMWPVADESKGADFRTGFDEMIAYCSSLGNTNNSYFFRRARHDDPGNDTTRIARNVQLLNMLRSLLENQDFPREFRGTGGATTFSAKYGNDDVRQIIVQIFDYIRSTNLVDNLLVGDRSTWPADKIGTGRNAQQVNGNPNPQWQTLYNLSETGPARAHKTFTPGSAKENRGGTFAEFADYPIPGSGQVTPAVWPVGGKDYKGFGRNVSISEIGLQFICTADGQNDHYSWITPVRQSPGSDSEPARYVRNPLSMVSPDGTSVGNPAVGIVSGGRTALMIDETIVQQRQLILQPPNGFVAGNQPNAPVITNLGQPGPAGVTQGDAQGNMKRRFYSNYPPNPGPNMLRKYFILPPGRAGTEPGGQLYGFTRDVHPAFQPYNWNYTLDPDTPLETNEKRVQAALTFEIFCPSVGYNPIHPEFTLVVDGNAVSAIQIQTVRGQQSLFSTTGNLIYKSNRNVFFDDQNQAVGGFAGSRRVQAGGRCQGRGSLPPDDGFDDNRKNQNGHVALLNFDLTSTFHTVRSDDFLRFTESPPIRVDVYDSHDWQGREPMQTVTFRLPAGQTPTPQLVVFPTYHVKYTRSNGTERNHPAIQAPRFWGFHRDGVMGRGQNQQGMPPAQGPQGSAWSMRGRHFDVPVSGANPTNERASNASAGRLAVRQNVPGGRDIIYAKDPGGHRGVNGGNNGADVNPPTVQQIQGDRSLLIAYNDDIPVYYGNDVVRTLQPRGGDPRIIAAKKIVGPDDWVPHVHWNNQDVYTAHNISNYHWNEAGFDYGGEGSTPYVHEPSNRILPTANLFFEGLNGNGQQISQRQAGMVPDAPHTQEVVRLARRYGDYDDTEPGGKMGPFINKPDEGNQRRLLVRFSNNVRKDWRGTYFITNDIVGASASFGTQFFSPNRMVPSPGVLGSLPTGVWDSNGQGAWQTLMFRADAPFVGAPNGSDHPGAATPPDHYLMELFWMPVVEPYVISEPLSTAGKINMNYQMLPFTHIRRATGLHAAMKDEKIVAIPDEDYANSRRALQSFTGNGSTPPRFFDESLTGQNQKVWHRDIVIDKFEGESRSVGTLKQFDDRFNFKYGPGGTFRQGLFRTPSQICEVHLIPDDSPVAGATNVSRTFLQVTGPQAFLRLKNEMGKFWAAHSSTGENSREKPYTNLYNKLTTKSNTFRVHVRVQALRKPGRSQAADRFELPSDLVDGEDPVQQFVTAEYRGSYLLERFIDVNDTANPLPDYAAAGDPLSLPMRQQAIPCRFRHWTRLPASGSLRRSDSPPDPVEVSDPSFLNYVPSLPSPVRRPFTPRFYPR